MTKEEIQASIKSIMFSGSVCGIEIYACLRDESGYQTKKSEQQISCFLAQKIRWQVLSIVPILQMMPNLIHQKILQTIRKNFMRLV